MRPLLNHLDAPLRFLIFTMPEAMSLMVPFLWGIGVNQFWKGCVSACVLYVIVRQFSRYIGVRRVRACYYWYFPVRQKIYAYPVCSSIRELIQVIVLIFLGGCQPAYHDFFDCPVENVARCQSTKKVYAQHNATVRRVSCRWFYAYHEHNDTIAGSVIVMQRQGSVGA